ncbi:MAG TPA: nuclear transport factor 2 family protein, partial [Bryobacteraceae bacterium]|nr:nuclear transport factor 2 family protein [Bryobacteraceae bacterium]
MSQENVKAVVAMYDAFARGDIDGVLADLAPDVHWSVAENFIYSDGNPYRGIEAVRNGVFGRVPGDWDSYDLEFEEILDAGEAVVSRG